MAELGFGFGLGGEKGVDLGPGSFERRAPQWLSGARARLVAPARAARRSVAPAADVLRPWDRVAAGRLAVEALERVVDDGAEPERIGVGSRRCGLQLVLDEPLVGQVGPALERVGAEHPAHAKVGESTAGTLSGPGQRDRVRETLEQGLDRGGAGRRPPPLEHRHAVGRPATERQGPGELALARRLGPARTPPLGTAGARESVLGGGGSGSGRSKISSRNGDRASAVPSSSQPCQLRKRRSVGRETQEWNR